MFNNLCKFKGWDVKNSMIGKSSIQVQLVIDRRFRFVLAWMLTKLFDISASSIRRIDHEVLATMLPPVNLTDLKATLIDEKYLGKANGFDSFNRRVQ